MPSGSYKQVDVRCPFYRSDDSKNHITCEGLVYNSTLTLNYRKVCDYRQQLEIFCCENYEKCEVYRMLMEKYEE